MLALPVWVGDNRGMKHLAPEQLMAGLDHICEAPRDRGELVAIVRRPAAGEREVLSQATLDDAVGLVGDSWLDRGSTSTPDGSAAPEKQVTIMNVRVAELVAGEGSACRWPVTSSTSTSISVSPTSPRAPSSSSELPCWRSAPRRILAARSSLTASALPPCSS